MIAASGLRTLPNAETSRLTTVSLFGASPLDSGAIGQLRLNVGEAISPSRVTASLQASPGKRELCDGLATQGARCSHSIWQA